MDWIFYYRRGTQKDSLSSPEYVMEAFRMDIIAASQDLNGHAGALDVLAKPNSKEITLAAILLQIANAVFAGGSGVDVLLECAMHLIREDKITAETSRNRLSRLPLQRFAAFDINAAVLRYRRPHLPKVALAVPPQHG